MALDDNNAFVFTTDIPFNSALGVEKVWEAYHRKLNTASISEYSKTIISELQTLQNTLIQQEQAFYSELKISGADSIKILQQRADQWAITGANQLLTSAFTSLLFDKITDNINVEDFESALNYFANEQIPEELAQEEWPNITSIINNAMEQLQEDKRLKEFKDKGLNVRYTISKIGNKFTIKLKEGAMPTRLEKELALILRKHSGVPQIQITPAMSPNIHKALDSILDTTITDNFAKKCIQYEITERAGNYNFCANRNVLQGWLGEIYWNAGLSYITGRIGASLPVGDTKNTSGKSLSVDIILNDVGFQVKNWQTLEMLQEQKHTVVATRQIGNFIVDTLDLKGSLAKVLLDMFAVYGYNKPSTYTGRDQITSKEDIEGIAAVKTAYEERYNTEYKFIEDRSFSPLNEIFSMYIDRLLRIDVGGKVASPTDPEQTLQFYNTFWLINDKIVPSSIIIADLIKGIENSNLYSPSSYIQFQVDKIILGKRKTQTPGWPQFRRTKEFNNQEMANLSAVTYHTTFDLKRILQKIGEKNG